MSTLYKPAFPVNTRDPDLDRKLESMAAFARRFRLPEGMAARCSLETREGHRDNSNDWRDRDLPEEAMQELEGFCGWLMLLDMRREFRVHGTNVASDGRHLTRRERRAVALVKRAWELMQASATAGSAALAAACEPSISELANPTIKPVSPGEHIREELEARGWTVTYFAHLMGRSKDTIRELLFGKARIDSVMAQDLANVFGTSAELWLNLERAYRVGNAAAKPPGGLFTDPPIDITGGMDAADYIAQLRGQLPDPMEPTPPATRCSACARDQGAYCSLVAVGLHPVWHDSGGVLRGVECACWLARTGGEVE